jgi:hypothetical protein
MRVGVAAVTNSMRYIWPILLLLVFLLGPLAPPVEAAPAKRPSGKRSSIKSVRNRQRFNRKPLVYNPKTNRPLVAKKRHWWQSR